MTAGDMLVEVEGLSKKFCRDLRTSLWYGVKDLSAELAGRSATEALRKKEFWAVKDISFTLRRGESLAIIGPNGAGKSTTLKMLNGLLKPNSGYIRMRGRVQALIALGAGFHPILTGRENIYINAAVLGIPRRVVKRQLESIVDFAELHDFIDTPVQSYSSGMKVRLGFAIAIHVEPDVLIIDEVLAVGDQRFRRKARNAMAELLEKDIALIFISHNMHEVMGITQRALWMERGQMVKLSDTPSVCAEYIYRSQTVSAEDQDFVYNSKRTGELAVTQVDCVVGKQRFDRRVTLDSPARDLTLTLTMTAHAPIDERIFHVLDLSTADGLAVGRMVLNDHIQAEAGQTIIRRFVSQVDYLHPGAYKLAYEVATDGGPILEGIQNLIYLDVEPPTWVEDHTTLYRPNVMRMLSNGAGALALPFMLEPPQEEDGQ